MPRHGYRALNDLLELAMAYRRSKPLLVALHFELFDLVDAGLDRSEALARRVEADPRALRVLLDALVGLGVLRASGPRYRNSRAARRFLVSSSPDYIGSNLKYQEHTWEAWSDLKNVVKTGRPNLGLIDWIHRDVFRESYVKAMGEVARWPARDLAAKLDLRGVRRCLDVGCGSGAYSAALVERKAALRATLLDLPNTLEVTQGLLARHPRAGRFSFRAANFLSDDLGEAEFDLVLISNVTHVEDAANNQRLVEKAFRALRPGGRLVIHDYVAGRARAGARFTGTLGLHLLVFTGRGNVYTLEEYSNWLRRADFRRVRHIPVAEGSLYSSMAIIGQKA